VPAAAASAALFFTRNYSFSQVVLQQQFPPFPVSRRVDVDDVPFLVCGESRHGNLAVGEGEQRVVLADADVLAGSEFHAALPHDDRAGTAIRVGPNLDAEPPPRRIASVVRRTAGLLRRHGTDGDGGCRRRCCCAADDTIGRGSAPQHRRQGRRLIRRGPRCSSEERGAEQGRR